MKKYSILIKSYCGAPDFEDCGEFNNIEEATDYWYKGSWSELDREYIKNCIVEE